MLPEAAVMKASGSWRLPGKLIFWVLAEWVFCEFLLLI
jgi:hypothetical protein